MNERDPLTDPRTHEDMDAAWLARVEREPDPEPADVDEWRAAA